jgi:purine-binding chemotaxis protein CheW
MRSKNFCAGSLRRVTHNMAEDKRFLIISLEGENYAIPITRLLEIMVSRNIQKDPKQTGFFEGKVDFRGTLIPVLNIKKHLKISGHAGTALLVVQGEKGTFGILVDTVLDILDVEQRPIPLPKGTVDPGLQCYSGILRYKEKLALLLNEDGLQP